MVNKSEEIVLLPTAPRGAVERIEQDIAELRADLRLRESVAVRAAYAFGEWPPEQS